MITGLLRRWVVSGCSKAVRELDPRRSITGKFAVAGLATSIVTAAVGMAGIWYVTTEYVTSVEQAQTVYRVGLLAIVAIAVVQFVAIAAVRRSLIGGLRALEKHTNAVLENGTHGTSFSSDRRDEIGQLSWQVAELQERLVTQVDAIESLNRNLTTIATSQSQTLAACRRGDLTRRMESDTGTPQFDALAMNFNEMMDRTETMVADVRSFSRTVADTAEDADVDAVAALEAVSTITDSTESMSVDASAQRDRVESTADAIDRLASSIDEIAAEAESVTERSKQTVREARAGKHVSGDALVELSNIRAQSSESVEEMDALSATVADATALLERVSELTTRTGQLAVNAQIAAARTDNGSNVTRLSKRIKALAADTEETAAEIEANLTAIDRRTDRAREAIEATQQSVERGTDTIETALNAFETVADGVESTTDGIAVIRGETETQTRRAGDVVDAADDLRSIGQRTAAEAMAMARTANEQEETIRTIAETLDYLSTTATTLEDHLEEFTVRPPASPTGQTGGVQR